MGELIYAKEVDIANNCRNCGMCRIDYLGTGTCHAAEEHVNFAHHPHGRLKIFEGLKSGELPLTTETQKVIDSCTLCGKCNIQCYYQLEMAPGEVFAAKRVIFKERLEQETIQKWPADEVLEGLLGIVGEGWAFNDPTILTAYMTFAAQSPETKVPAYVALPKDAAETAAVVRLANKHGIPFLPISSGTNSSDFIKNKIILIDMGRLKTLHIDTKDHWAEVGAGILAFDLQQAAMKEGLRFSIGEAPAGVCANQVSTGIHSFFGYKNGVMADHYIEAELVTNEGEIIQLTSANAPQITTSPKGYHRPSLPGICTRLKTKLYPVDKKETVILIPFASFEKGLTVTKSLANKGIGTGMGLVGVEALSNVISFTEFDSDNFLDIAHHYLKINCAIMMLLNDRDLDTLRSIHPELTIINQKSIQGIAQGIPAITGPESMALIEDIMDEDQPYDHLFGEGMLDYFLKQIQLSNEEISEIFSHLDNNPLRKVLSRRYFDPEYSDPEYWFNYRTFSPREFRKNWFFSVMYFTDSDDPSLITELLQQNKTIGDLHNIHSEFGYMLALDGGKRFFFEYEFFCDQHDEEMLARLKKVFFLVAHESKKMVKDGKGIYPVLNTLFNGLNKKELYLYGESKEKLSSVELETLGI